MLLVTRPFVARASMTRIANSWSRTLEATPVAKSIPARGEGTGKSQVPRMALNGSATMPETTENNWAKS